MKIALDFYKDLFAREERGDLILGRDFWAASDLVSEEENKILCAPFSEDEIKDAILAIMQKVLLGLTGSLSCSIKNFGI